MGWKLVSRDLANIKEEKLNSDKPQVGSNHDRTLNHNFILQLQLSELAKRNMAVEIYSVILGCHIWLCSNDLMALQIKEDCPEAVTYTTEEMRWLIKLRPAPEDLRAIHDSKAVFSNSSIVYSRLKGE